MQVESNFRAWLEDDAGLVAGSVREGHNVLTDHGREWLRRVVVWSLVGTLGSVNDVVLDARRLRWLGLGSGTLTELTNVEGLAAPLSVSIGPTRYLRVLGTRTHPIDTSVKFVTTFSGASADFDHHGASVSISEAGMFADVDTGSGPGLDPSLSIHTPVAYKAFAPLTKLAAQTLTITWEFRF